MVKNRDTGSCVLWVNQGSATYWLGGPCFYAYLTHLKIKKTMFTLWSCDEYNITQHIQNLQNSV